MLDFAIIASIDAVVVTIAAHHRARVFKLSNPHRRHHRCAQCTARQNRP